MNTRGERVTMDWYCWLSKTNLEQALVYKYGLIFVHNELQEEDLTYFNHEFLQSIGIGVAKHRVEILNMARKEGRKRLNGFSRIILAMNKTKKLLAKNLGKLSFHKSSCQVQVSELTPYRNKQEKTMATSRNVIKSGPIDIRVHDKFVLPSRTISVSGPLDGKVQGRITYPNWSPMATTAQPTESRSKDNLGFFSRSPTVVEPMLKSRSVSVSGPLDSKVQGRITYPNLSPVASTAWPTEGRPKDNLGFYSRSPTVVEPIDKRVQDKFTLKSRSVSVSGPLDSKVQGRFTYPNLSPVATTAWPTEGRPKENLGFYSRSPTVDRRVQEKFMITSRRASVSESLDSKVHGRIRCPNRSPMATTAWPTEGRPKENLGLYCRSPSVSEPLDKWGLSPKMNYYSSVKLGDDDGPQSLWSTMFQDIKPT